jgi:hypothetical protein
VSSIELIRSGILGGEWALVCEGYEGMTGQRLEPPAARMSVAVSVPDSFVADLKRHIDEEVAKLRAGPWPEVARALESRPEYPRPGVDYVAQTSDELAARHRQVAAAAGPPKAAGPVDEFAKFHVPMGRTQPAAPGNGERSVSTPLPYDPKEFKNEFQDDGRVASGDIELDRKMTAKMTPTQRRPEAKPVEVVCGKCNRPEKVPPALVPPSLGSAGDVPTYVCNACARAYRR